MVEWMGEGGRGAGAAAWQGRAAADAALLRIGRESRGRETTSAERPRAACERARGREQLANTQLARAPRSSTHRSLSTCPLLRPPYTSSTLGPAGSPATSASAAASSEASSPIATAELDAAVGTSAHACISRGAGLAPAVSTRAHSNKSAGPGVPAPASLPDGRSAERSSCHRSPSGSLLAPAPPNTSSRSRAPPSYVRLCACRAAGGVRASTRSQARLSTSRACRSETGSPEGMCPPKTQMVAPRTHAAWPAREAGVGRAVSLALNSSATQAVGSAQGEAGAQGRAEA
jgi:hypothetical protein